MWFIALALAGAGVGYAVNEKKKSEAAAAAAAAQAAAAQAAAVQACEERAYAALSPRQRQLSAWSRPNYGAGYDGGGNYHRG